MASRAIHDLHPAVARRALAHMEVCKEQGIELLIYCTYRSTDEQDKLYAQGRTDPGKIITNARGGQSTHQYRCAYDAVPVINGKAVWDDLNLIIRVGQLGETCGLEWAGRWSGKLKETVHYQYTGGYSINELRLGKVPQ